MPYSPYASEEYYKECYTGTLIPEDEQRKALIQASRHIDTLTYNRIVSQGFSNLQNISRRSSKRWYASRQNLNMKMQMKSTVY